MAAKKKTKRAMSAEHKEALAKGRAQGKSVRDYLAALEEQKKPGRRVSRDELEQRLSTTREQIETEPDPAKRLDLIQKRLDIEERMNEQGEEVDLEKLEKEFVKVAKDYAERKGITYTAFREAGVPAATLKEAGIPRTRKSSAA